MDNKDIFVDFDGTICPNKNGDPYAPPDPKCLETLKLLQDTGHKIVLYSVRCNQMETNKLNGHIEMLEYLKKYNIPYDYFDYHKPHFRMVIDDKGLGVPLDGNKNVDWTKVHEILEMKLK